MARLKVRRFSKRDFDDYAETLLRSWPCDDIEEARENVHMAVEQAERGEEYELWVAEFDRRAKGFMLLEFTRTWGRKGESFREKAAGINWLDVHPDSGRRGLGTSLVRKAVLRAKAKSLRRVFMHTAVTNLRAIYFATRNGFTLRRHLREFWGKGTADAFLLVLEVR